MLFQKQTRGSDISGRGFRFRENGNFRETACITAPRFFLFDFGVCGSDQLISCLIQFAVRVHLIADAALGIIGKHGGAFITERVRVLESTEFAPRAVEFAGHAEKIKTEIAAVCGGHRIMIVSPAAGRQRLQFQMAEIRQDLLISERDVAAVVENRHFGIHTAQGFKSAFVIVQQHLTRVCFAVFRFLRIVSLPIHAFHARRTAARRLRNNVEKNSVRLWKQCGGFDDMFAQIVQISCIETERMKSRFQRACHPSGVRPLGVDFPPFGMVFRHIIVDPGGQIDGNIDVDFLAGVHLGAEEIEFQIRVHHSDFGRVIAHSVVTEGETGDGINVCGF